MTLGFCGTGNEQWQGEGRRGKSGRVIEKGGSGRLVIGQKGRKRGDWTESLSQLCCKFSGKDGNELWFTVCTRASLFFVANEKLEASSIKKLARIVEPAWSLCLVSSLIAMLQLLREVLKAEYSL